MDRKWETFFKIEGGESCFNTLLSNYRDEEFMYLRRTITKTGKTELNIPNVSQVK